MRYIIDRKDTKTLNINDYEEGDEIIVYFNQRPLYLYQVKGVGENKKIVSSLYPLEMKELSLLQNPENRIKFNSISKEIVYSGCDYWEAMNGYVYFFAKTIDGVPTFFLLNEINNERFIEKNQKIYNEIVILLGELNN